jgi:hypothetical protein
VSNLIDGRAIGRVVGDWNSRYPATPLRIDAITRDSKTVYSAQLGFPDGTSAEFDITTNVLHAPVSFPNLVTRRGPNRYSQGQWMLFDELSGGAFSVVTKRLGGIWATDRSTRRKITTLTAYSRKT